MGNVDELIQAQVLAARAACEQTTSNALKLLIDSVDRACCLPSKPGWKRKAAAHAEIFRLLADVAGHPAASPHRRLLACVSAGDAEGTARRWKTISGSCTTWVC
jgi:hypothetical protein